MTSTSGPASPGADSPAGPRRRDAAKTRQLLLEAARQRFACDGYVATTLRDIADDAGVNVALISRYFDSKEGLFGACLSTAVDEFRRVAGTVPLDQIPEAIATQAAGFGADGRPNHVLLLLLRSSGDDAAEQVRIGFLRTFAERLASAAGWRPEHPDADRLMLRAQLVLSAAVGIVLMRSSLQADPLASATARDLAGPLRDLVTALLGREVTHA